MGSRRTKLTLALIALTISLSACSTTIVPISGTPSAEQVLSNARRVAHHLESYRSTVTIVETIPHRQSPALDTVNSNVHFIEVGSEEEFRLDLSWGLELVQSNGKIYSRMESKAWSTVPLSGDEGERFPGGAGPMKPGGHPDSWLNSRHLNDTQLSGQIDLDGRSVYLIEALVPMTHRSSGTHPSILSDSARLYVDTSSFQLVRVEVDRYIERSEQEASGYQVAPGVVEIKTLEIYEYSGHNAEIEIKSPEAIPSA